MSYRGFGGYRGGDVWGTIYRRRRRGDAFDTSYPIDTSNFDPSASDGSSSDTSLGTPDFSDVTGGSSTAFNPADIMGAGLPALPAWTGGVGSGIGSAISKFMGGGGLGSYGPGVGTAVGTAITGGASLGSGTVARAVKHLMKHVRAGGAPGRRHMNPGNFKALRRSLRRLKSFEHAAKRVYTFTHRAPGRAKFKFPKRRKR